MTLLINIQLHFVCNKNKLTCLGLKTKKEERNVACVLKTLYECLCFVTRSSNLAE